MAFPYKRKRLELSRFMPYQLNRSNSNQQNPILLDSNTRSRRSIQWDLEKEEQITPISLPDGPLFERSQLISTWINPRTIGPGISNIQNNCFLNSVLECLTYTPSLAQYFLYHGHKKHCTLKKFCAMCLMEKHVQCCLEEPTSLIKGAIVYPWKFLVNIQAFSRTLSLGNQEDAHEFMMFLLDAMHKSTVQKYGVMDTKVERTAFIYQIFGGQLRSQLRCHSCNAKSDTFSNFLVLSVDIQDADSVLEAMNNFTMIERIGGNDSDSKYHCESCDQKVDAEKQMTIHELPSCLCVHLKRFTFDIVHGSMVKLIKDIRYGEYMDMAPFILEEVDFPSMIYNLYAVLVHFGVQCDRGHYLAYVKAPDGKWFRMDDDEVYPVSIIEVLSQQAYMLFYAKQDHPPSEYTTNESSSADILSCHPTPQTTVTSEKFSQMINSQRLSPSIYSDQLSPSSITEQLSQVVISSQSSQEVPAAAFLATSSVTSPVSNTAIVEVKVPGHELDTTVNENMVADDARQLFPTAEEIFNEEQGDYSTDCASLFESENQLKYSSCGYMSPPNSTIYCGYILDSDYDSIQINDGYSATNGSNNGVDILDPSDAIGQENRFDA